MAEYPKSEEQALLEALLAENPNPAGFSYAPPAPVGPILSKGVTSSSAGSGGAGGAGAGMATGGYGPADPAQGSGGYGPAGPIRPTFAGVEVPSVTAPVTSEGSVAPGGVTTPHGYTPMVFEDPADQPWSARSAPADAPTGGGGASVAAYPMSGPAPGSGGPAPRPRSPGGMGGAMPRPPAGLDPELGVRGLYYKPGFVNEVISLVKQGKMTNEQAKAEIAGYEKWKPSSMALGADMAERGREAFEERQSFEQQKLELQRQEYEQKKALAQEQREREQADIETQKRIRADFDREYQDQTAQYEQAIEEVRTSKIDPRRVSIPVFDAISVGLGAAAAALNKGPNFAMEIVNKRIDQDIAAQQANIKTLQSSAAMRRNRLGMLRERFGDEQQAMQTERRMQLESVQTQITEMANSTQSQSVKVNADQMLAATAVELQKNRDEEQLRIRQAAEQMAMQAEQNRRGVMAGRIKAKQDAEKQAQMQRTGFGDWITGKGSSDYRKRYVKGYGFAADPAMAKELNQQIVMSERIVQNAGRIKELMMAPGYATDLKKQAEAESLKTGTMFAMRYKEKTGALDAGSTELFDKRLPIGKVMTAGAAAGLDQTARDTQAGLQAVIAREQITPGQYGRTLDEKTGQPTEGYRLGMPGTQGQPRWYAADTAQPKIDEITHTTQ